MTRSIPLRLVVGLVSTFALPACSTTSKEPDTRPAPVVVPEPTAESPARGSEPVTVMATDPRADQHRASVGGVYGDLIKTVYVPGDLETYGEFNNYGWWGPGPWAGEMQPAGYWVYVYPHWFVWATTTTPDRSFR
jgi:hypothetical protein